MSKNNIGIIVTGVAELDRAMRALPEKLRNKAIRPAMREVTKRIVLPTAVDFAPEDTGRLKKSLRVRAAKNSRGGRLPRHVVGFAVVWTDKDAYYGKFQELGTKTIKKPEGFLRPGLYRNKHLLQPALSRLIQPRIREVVASAKHG